MDYQESDHQIQLDQNKSLFENTRLTRWTLFFAIIGTIGTFISAIADVLQVK